MPRTPETIEVEIALTPSIIAAGASASLTEEQMLNATLEFASRLAPTELHKATSELVQDLTPDAMRATVQQITRQLDEMGEHRATPNRLFRRAR